MRGAAMAGALPIPFDKIHWYAERVLMLDDEGTAAFVWIMRRVDNHFIGMMNKRSNDSTK